MVQQEQCFLCWKYNTRSEERKDRNLLIVKKKKFAIQNERKKGKEIEAQWRVTVLPPYHNRPRANPGINASGPQAKVSVMNYVSLPEIRMVNQDTSLIPSTLMIDSFSVISCITIRGKCPNF